VQAAPSTAPENAFVGAVHKLTRLCKWIFRGGAGGDPPLKMNLQGWVTPLKMIFRPKK